MKRIRFVVFLALLVAVGIGAGLVNAQGQGAKGTPPTPEMVAEINGTRGAALLKFYP